MTAGPDRNIPWDEDLERGDGSICSVSDGVRNQPTTSLDEFSPNQDSVPTDDVRAVHSQDVDSRDFSPERLPQQAERHDEEPSGPYNKTHLVLGPDLGVSLPPQEELLRTRTQAVADDESTDSRERERDRFSEESSTSQDNGASEPNGLSPMESRGERDRMSTSGSDSVQNEADHRSFHLSHHRSALVLRLVPRESNPIAYLQKLAKSILSHMRKSSDTTEGTSDEGVFTRTEKDQNLEVSFAEMQRMKLRKLQSKLIKHAVDIRCREEEPVGWEDDLKQYTDAIRDYHYMTSFGDSADDPFLASSMRFIDHFVIQTLTKEEELERKDSLRSVSVPWAPQNHVRPIIDVRNRHVAEAWLKGFKQRLLMAATGGFFLIGPMWLMVKRNDQNTSLIATTAFVALFGILMARNLDSPKEVMSNTAAYAAVLVVFVGLGGTPST